jgi:hypothetical protein
LNPTANGRLLSTTYFIQHLLTLINNQFFQGHQHNRLQTSIMSTTVHKRPTTSSALQSEASLHDKVSIRTTAFSSSSSSSSSKRLSIPNGNGTSNVILRQKRLRRRTTQKTTSTRIKMISLILLGILLFSMTIYTGFYILGRSDHSIEEEEEEEESEKFNLEIFKKRFKERQKLYSHMNPDNPPLTNNNGFFQNSIMKLTQYQHADIMENIGDKSPRYAKLRHEMDEKFPRNDIPRMQSFVKSLHKHTYGNRMAHDMDYDIHNCPFDPPMDYPHAWKVKDVLDHWPADDTAPRDEIYQGLCIFDFQQDYEKAINYRKMEVPFVIRNDPAVMRAVERWNQPDYLSKLLGDKRYITEYSPNNHFMYWNRPNKKKLPEGYNLEHWKPPTEMMRTTFQEWIGHANVTDETLLGPDHEHWYYRLIGCGESVNCESVPSEFLFDELSFFQPRNDNELYMPEPRQQKGIHCRFGMKGVIAENHFDGSRNMIVVLGGERRYILSHPYQCENLCLYPKGHPSARHSEVDWSEPDWESFPKFKDAEVNEVILQAGDVLYLPTFWFHYIISLELNYQCNTRSGVSDDYTAAIRQCGF